MPPVSGNIPNLIGGVSQQPDSLRLPNQLEAQDNCYSSPVDGLHDRPPVEHLAKIHTGTLGDCFTHLSNRSVDERYEIIITDGTIQVFDLAGNAKSVDVVEGAEAYLASLTPSTDFKIATVADTTFVVNTKKVVAMDSDESVERGSEALLFVRQGAYGCNYSVFLNGSGSSSASYTTSETDPGDLATDVIAADLASDLVAAGFTITRKGSVIHIVKNDGTPFSIRVSDSLGGNGLKVFQKSAPRFSELPDTAPDGYVLAIDANPETQAGRYYVKFAVSSVGETFAQGTWAETVAPGVKYKFDPSTMPHRLIPDGDGTFTFGPCVWAERECGDDLSNPEPSFVGDVINDVWFYKNRLSFFSDENFIMSEVFEPFNFWRTTVTQVLDSDPVDARVAHTKVSILKHAVPFNTHMVFFSDQSQFRMLGDNAITPKTVKADPQTDYESEMGVKPVGFGKSIFFGATSGDWSSVWELTIDDQNDTLGARNVASHVPKYIPAGLYKFAVSTLEQILVCLTKGDRSRVYVYKYLYNERDEKVQSSWSRWTIEDGTILGADFVGTTLMLIVQYSDGVYLQKIDVAPGRTDSNSAYVTHLDRRITDDQCTAQTYNANTNRTKFELPYEVAADDPMKVVTRSIADMTGLLPAGSYLPVLAQGTVSGHGFVEVGGNMTAQPVWIGKEYERSLELSKIYRRKQTSTGGTAIDATGVLQLLGGFVTYDDTGLFTVEVTPEGRGTSAYVFTGKLVGDLNNILGQVVLSSGTFKFGILSNNEHVRIVIKTRGFLPMRLSSIDWEGTWVKRSRGV
jgi:hypothetical protein